MTNLKCSQCNFVNFADAVVCKRCGASLYTDPDDADYGQKAQVSVKTKNEQRKPAVLVELAPKKLGVAAGFMWIIVLLACVLSAVQIYYAYREDSSPKQTANIAFGLAIAVVPYCIARAVDKLSG